MAQQNCRCSPFSFTNQSKDAKKRSLLCGSLAGVSAKKQAEWEKQRFRDPCICEPKTTFHSIRVNVRVTFGPAHFETHSSHATPTHAPHTNSPCAAMRVCQCVYIAIIMNVGPLIKQFVCIFLHLS